MNWITQKKRLAIYLRDGMACVWCRSGVEHGAKLTLDHVKPHSKNGSNHESNLITACHFCNTSRNAKSMAGFARTSAQRHNVASADLLGDIRRKTARVLRPYVKQAEELIASRGGLQQALRTQSNN